MLVRWFDDIAMTDVPDVGIENASLGEMYRELAGRACRSRTASRRQRAPNYTCVGTGSVGRASRRAHARSGAQNATGATRSSYFADPDGNVALARPLS
jgi:hypothetical protein